MIMICMDLRVASRVIRVRSDLIRGYKVVMEICVARLNLGRFYEHSVIV
jgi:hypothetical protein